MDKNTDPFDFENYQPHQAISIPISRRGFLSAVVTELKVFNKKADGVLTLKTADLGLLSEEDFNQLKPMVVPGCKIKLKDQMVWATPPAAMEPLVLFPVDAPALTAFNHFNGSNTIAQIRALLIEKTGWVEEKAQAYCRGLFLKLVSMRVCVPG